MLGARQGAAADRWSRGVEHNPGLQAYLGDGLDGFLDDRGLADRDNDHPCFPIGRGLLLRATQKAQGNGTRSRPTGCSDLAMETLQRDHWSARKSLLVLFGDWGIATAAFVLAYSMHHYNGDSIIPGLVSVAAITISAVSFVGAPIVVVRRSGQSRWLFAFFVSGVLIGGFLLGCAEYHHVRSAHALAKIQKAFGAAEQVTKTT